MKYSKEQLQSIASRSTSVSDIIKELGIKLTGSNHRHIRSRLRFFDIDISHFTKKYRTRIESRKGFGQILVNNRLYYREKHSTLRRCLLEAGIKEECIICAVGTIWNNKPLVLQIDHINSDWKDNRIENLRFLCPNCHTQITNPKKSKVDRRKLPRSKIRPSKDDLEKLVKEMPLTKIAKQFNVSDKAVAKWCVFYNIERHPRGYWNKMGP